MKKCFSRKLWISLVSFCEADCHRDEIMECGTKFLLASVDIFCIQS